MIDSALFLPMCEDLNGLHEATEVDVGRRDTDTEMQRLKRPSVWSFSYSAVLEVSRVALTNSLSSGVNDCCLLLLCDFSSCGENPICQMSWETNPDKDCMTQVTVEQPGVVKKPVWWSVIITAVPPGLVFCCYGEVGWSQTTSSYRVTHLHSSHTQEKGRHHQLCRPSSAVAVKFSWWKSDDWHCAHVCTANICYNQ